jgi:hypothetical protein
MTRLTKAQQRLVHELGELTKELGFDPTALMEAGETSAQLTASLDLARRNRIAAAVVSGHTSVDDLLGGIVVNYFFRGADSASLRRTKRYRRFNHPNP